MRKGIFIPTVLILLGIASCTTQKGEIVAFTVGTGGVIVNSTITGARIFIDYRDSGQKTPAIIEDIPAGLHVIHLFLNRHRVVPDSILVEIKEGAETTINFELTETSSAGNLEVTTTPEGALVLVDNLPFGRTPLTINGLLSGRHKLRLMKGGYEKVQESIHINVNQRTPIQRALSLKPQLILVEHFSNTDCPPCPQADDIIEAIVKEKGPDSVAVLSYHPDFPGRQDPFFLAAKEENLARYDYYGRPPLPFAVIDGVNRMAGTLNLEARFRSALQNRSGRNPVATLDFWGLTELKQESNFISGRVRVEALQDLPATNIFLHLALIERDITFPVAPGSNGQKHFFDVMRALYPAPQGYPVLISKGQSEFFDFRFARQPDWKGELQVVAFLQNHSTGEVLQSLWSAR